MGLVCGFVLTQQQAAAAATNAPDPTATSMVAPRSTATAKSAEPTQKEQSVNQQTSTQKAVTTTDTVNETAKQNQIAVTQTPATNTSTQTATSNNNPTNSAQPSQETVAQNTATISSANSANEATQPVSQPTAPTTTPATKATNSTNATSNTTDPQVETIAQGTWGTSKWEYTHQGTDYILHFHAGTLGASSQKTITDPNGYHQYFLGSIGASPEVFNGNWQWNEELTQIIIDPGVIANQDSSYLFGHLKNLKKIVGLTNLDTTNVNNMAGMFEGCLKLTSLDVSKLNTDKVTDTSWMFADYQGSQLDFSHFNTANVTNMSGMFSSYQGSQLDFSHFNTANVTDMSYMFEGYEGPQLDFSNFDTSNVTNMAGMFDGYKGSQLDFSHFNTANVTDMSSMFAGYKGPQLDLSNFNTANVTDMSWMFSGYQGPKLDFSHFNTANVTDMIYMFEGYEGPQLDFSNFDTSNVTNMSEMFKDCDLTSLDLSNFNTSKVTNMSEMFAWSERLTSLDLSNFNTANVTDMYDIFRGCRNLTNLNLSNWDNDNITDMSWMFYDCYSLTNLNLSNFHTTNVTDMSWMFHGCSGLTSLDLSSFNTAKVTNMEAMFSSCSSLTSLDLNNFNTANVDHMRYMFGDCMGLTSLDLSNFDLSKIVDMDSIFHYCRNLNHLILGPKTEFKYVYLLKVPNTGTRLLGTDRVVASPYWVATSGYQQGHKYTSNDLMELTGRDQVTTYDWDSKPAFTQTTETKTKVRTINLHQPNGQLKTETQTVAVSRPVTINPDGSKTYGAWTTAQWDQYTVPEWAGYQASQKQVPATTVSGDSANTTIDIYYQPLLQNVEIQYLDQGKVVGTQTITGYTGQTLMPNYQAPQGYEIVAAAPATITIDATGHQIIQVQVAHKINNSTEFNALTRTVNIHRPDGTMKTYIQTAVLKRNVYIDGVTGAKTYGAWSTDNWDAIQIPVFAGYTASQDQVAAHQVTGEDSDQTVDVYYTPINTN